MEDCIFCLYGSGAEKTDILWQNDEFYCINDKYPEAPIHLLVIPKAHVDKMKDTLKSRDSEFWKRYMDAVFEVVEALHLNEKGYEIGILEAGYQGIDHEHIHIKSGKK